MAADKTKVMFVGGANMTVDGDLQQVTEQLATTRASAGGFNPLTVKGRPVYVNRDHVLWVQDAPSKQMIAH